MSKTQKKFLSAQVFLITLLSFFTIGTYNTILSFHKSNQPLSKLSVPKRPRIFLPAFLELPYLLTDILGMETIDPKDIVKYANQERLKVGSNPLRINQTLMKAAQLRADVILKYQNFSHQDPYEGIELGSILPKLNYHYLYAAENIGMGGLSAYGFVDGFMHSASHKATLLSPQLTDTGIAVVTGPYKEYYVNIAVQLFAIPSGRDEYLGYSEIDKQNYHHLLAQVNSKLSPVNLVLNKILQNRNLTADEYQKLKRQKDILTVLYNQMKEDKPLQNSHIALIYEFNDLL